MAAQVPESDLAVLDAATALFAEALRVLSAEEHLSPSGAQNVEALPGWSQRVCANHVLGGGIRYAAYFPVARHEVGEDIAWSRDFDHAGQDPLSAVARTSAPLREEFRSAPDAEALVPHRLADISISNLLALRVIELVLHAWDLDPTCWNREIPESSYSVEEIAAWLLERGLPVLETMRGFGVFAAPVAANAEAPRTATSRLLEISGRHPLAPRNTETPKHSGKQLST